MIGNKKKLLIDGKWLFNGPVSGRYVVRSQIRELIRGNRFSLYLVIERGFRDDFILEFGKELHIIELPKSIMHFFVNMFFVSLFTYKYKIDVVFTQNIAPLISSAKTVCFVHDVLYRDFPEYFTKSELYYFKLIDLSIRLSDRVVTISHHEVSRIVSNGLKQRDLVDCVYNGVEKIQINSANHEKLLEVKEKYLLPDLFVFYLGRINKRKNISNLIRSLVYLPKEICIVIGGKKDHLSEDLDSICLEYGFYDRTVFTGFIQSEDLQFVYQLADLFCFPSQAEGFGLPPLEAMAHGVPVVVSNKTCLPEVCGDAAVYFDPDKPKDIARAIMLIRNNRELRIKLIEKGLKRSSQFTWKKSASALEKIIDKV